MRQTLTLSMAHHFGKTARRATGAAVIAAPAAAEGGAERAPRGATRQSKRGSWGGAGSVQTTASGVSKRATLGAELPKLYTVQVSAIL